jgi:3-methylfumaryl-CoA hydratase
MLLAGLVHSYSAEQVAIAIERQDLAYRPGHADGAPAPSAPSSVAIPAADLRWDIETSAALLFRYSALTFNAHRIHYDRDYARHSEGYEDILVHGPLQATLLLNCAARLLGEAPARFRYRSLRPLPASLGAIVAATAGPGGVTCTAYDGWGRPTMEGNASL